MSELSRWSAGAAVSAAFHVAVAAAFVPFLAPRPIEQEPASPSRLEMAALSLPATSASELAPAADEAPEATPTASGARHGAVPAAAAEPRRPELSESVEVAASGDPLAAANLDAKALRPGGVPDRPAPARPTGGAPLRAAAATATDAGTLAPRRFQAPTIGTGETPVAAIEPDRDIRLAPHSPGGVPVLPARAKGDKAPAASAQGRQVPAARLSADQAGPAPVPETTVVAVIIDERDTRLAAVPPRRHSVFATRAAGNSAEAAPATGRGVAEVQLAGVRADRAPVQGSAVAAHLPEMTEIRGGRSGGARVPAVTPGGEPAAAVLAWSGDLSVEVRQQTVEAAAALRVADPAANGKELRDEVAERLGEIFCARAQTSYDPDTGTLNLLGHVRNRSDREQLVQTLERELQGAVPVVDRLRNLGEPQCVVLTRLAGMPLPQSVEQFTNPLVLGKDLQARTYSFTEGEAMRFEVAGADYDAWVYLDYYDGEGRVLHLLPNPIIPPLMLKARDVMVFGGGGPEDIARGRLALRVSPPFGQDIAVAMVVNRRLFDAPRDMVEEAGPYLSALASRLREMRDEHQDFRGEWVYLFVDSGPATRESE